jgi:hypothetical protein
MAKKQPQQMSSAYEALALYNAERGRGIVHTQEWDERMAVLQARWDQELAQEAEWEAEAHTHRRRRQIGLLG